MQLRIGDMLKPVSFDKIHLREGFVMPNWLEANVKEKQVKFAKMPALEDLSGSVKVQLIIEYYSR
jgi:ribosomal protein S4